LKSCFKFLRVKSRVSQGQPEGKLVISKPFHEK